MYTGVLYRFYFDDIEKAREYMRGWYSKVDFCMADIIKQGFIDMYSYNPENTAQRFGGARYEIVNK